jgi:hypothetical protein
MNKGSLNRIPALLMVFIELKGANMKTNEGNFLMK